MRKSFSDPDFSLVKGSPARRHDERVREQCKAHQRARVSLPTGKSSKPWKVTGEDAPKAPLWRAERDGTGKVISMTQLRRDAQNMDADHRFTGRRYKCEISRACCVGGEPLEPGAMIDCYADAAFSVHGVCGRITEEYPEA